MMNTTREFMQSLSSAGAAFARAGHVMCDEGAARHPTGGGRNIDVGVELVT
jgi:hypothetical protein